jgi:HAD superfamily hydrolase (TIGR01509 family)
MAMLVALSGDDRWDSVSDTIERYELATAGRSAAMPGLVEALAATAHLSRAVVTLLPERAARVILDVHGVEIATLIPRRSDYRPKPAPDQILRALDALGVAAGDAVFIGDSSWDAQAARAAGVQFVGVTNDGVSALPPDVEACPNLHAAVTAALGDRSA